jgi:hypothetical protein
MIIDLTQQATPDVLPIEAWFNAKITETYGISVIMVIQDAVPLVFDAIAAAAQQPFVQQIILIDNGNHPSLQSGLQKLNQDITFLHLLKMHRPLSQTEALYKARGRVTQPYVLVVDQHHALSNNATHRLLMAAHALSGRWMMGVKRQNRAKADLPSCTYLSTPKEALKQVLGLDSSPLVNVARDNALQPYYVPAANSACVFMPTHVAVNLDWWQGKTTLFGGYTDFCLRLHKQQGNVYYLPEVTATELLPRKPTWRYQWSSLRGIVSYFNQHYRETSRLLRWPLAALLSVRTLFKR